MAIVSFAEIVSVFLPLILTVTSPVASDGKLIVNVTSSFVVIFSTGSTTIFIEGVVLIIVIVADLVTLLWLSSTLVVTVNVYLPPFKVGNVISLPKTLAVNSSSPINETMTSPIEFSATTLIIASSP